MHWTISLIGDLLLCGEDTVEDVKIWYDPKTQITHLRAKSKDDLPLPISCLVKNLGKGSKQPNTPPRNTLAANLIPSYNTEFNILLKDNRTFTELHDNQLELLYNGKSYELEGTLSMIEQFWIGRISVSHEATNSFVKAMYPEMSFISRMILDEINITEVNNTFFKDKFYFSFYRS